uniref:Uncharacterized protein n=1 Tax=Megaselia scalaris TaxID=36166 RepID=T1GXF0_MEGSC
MLHWAIFPNRSESVNRVVAVNVEIGDSSSLSESESLESEEEPVFLVLFSPSIFIRRSFLCLPLAFSPGGGNINFSSTCIIECHLKVPDPVAQMIPVLCARQAITAVNLAHYRVLVAVLIHLQSHLKGQLVVLSIGMINLAFGHLRVQLFAPQR